MSQELISSFPFEEENRGNREKREKDGKTERTTE